MSANKSNIDDDSGRNRSKRIDDVDDNIKNQQQEQNSIKKSACRGSANSTKHLPTRSNRELQLIRFTNFVLFHMPLICFLYFTRN